MRCERCLTLLEDDLKLCPTCGTNVEHLAKKQAKERRSRFIVWLSDFCSLLMMAINTFILATSSHYAKHLEQGLWFAKIISYQKYPTMKIVDLVFAVFLLAMLVAFTLARYHMYRERKIGMLIMIASYGAHLLWPLSYFAVCFMVTGVSSAILPFCIAQTLVLLILASLFSLYFIKSKQYLF